MKFYQKTILYRFDIKFNFYIHSKFYQKNDFVSFLAPSELQHCVRLIWDEEILLEEVEVVVELSNGNHENLGFDDFVSLIESAKEDEKLEDLRKAFSMYEIDGTDCITPKSLN